MIDERRLRQLYLDEQQSIRAIAASEGLPPHTVYNALKRYRIPRRNAGFPAHGSSPHPPLDEATLRRLYIDGEHSIRAIAGMFQISSRQVYDALTHYHIPRRSPGYRPAAEPGLVLELGSHALDKARLRQLYEQEGQSIAAIAALYGCPPNRIRTALVRWGIALRRRGRPAAPRR
jgi:transposase-like protein